MISSKVDIIGKCGQHDPDGTQNPKAEKRFEENYKFYISFENSLCNQYVTEKVFLRLKHNIVPIVYGQANYSQILPPHSYINIQDFPSAKALAKFLVELGNNPEEYLSYFWWKDHFSVRRDDTDIMEAMFCKLCKKLHDNTLPDKNYGDLGHWWRKGACHKNGYNYNL